MIIELNGVDEAMLLDICRCDAAQWNCAGIVLVKEDQGKVLYWSVRDYRFEPLDAHVRPVPYRYLKRAYNSRKEHGGQLALWLRPDISWSKHPLISKIIQTNGKADIILSNGEKVPAALVVEVRDKLHLLDRITRRILVSLCSNRSPSFVSGRCKKQFHDLHFIREDGVVAPAIKSIVLETVNIRGEFRRPLY